MQVRRGPATVTGATRVLTTPLTRVGKASTRPEARRRLASAPHEQTLGSKGWWRSRGASARHRSRALRLSWVGCPRVHRRLRLLVLVLGIAAFGSFLAGTVGVLARYARPLPYVKETVGIAAMVWLVTYAVLAFRRAYGGTTVRAVLRTAVVGVGYFLALIAAIGAIVAPAIRRLIS